MTILFKIASVAGVLVVAVLALHPAPGNAQGVDKGCSPTVANPCTGGGGSSSGYASVFGNRPLIDDLKGLFKGRSKDSAPSSPAYTANEQGVVAYNNSDWANAVALFQDAVNREPNDATYQANLAFAKQALSNAQANQDRQRRQEQEAAAQRDREEQERKQRDKAAADSMQRAIQSFAGTLGSAPAAGGLDFDGNSGRPSNGLDFASTLATPNPANTGCAQPGDTRTVDACNVPSGLSKDVENAIAGAYRDAPPGVIERVRKGFQAVAARDWKVATAWFQDALSRDPNNAGLKRMIEISQYTLPDKPSATSTALQLPSKEDMELLFPPDTAPASAATGRPPSQGEVDEYFNSLRKGGQYTPSKELRLYLNGMPREDFNRLANISPPSASAIASTTGPQQRTGAPATYIPPGPQRDEFMRAVLMDEMMGLKPIPENEALIKVYQWDDMGRLMYRMAHEPPDPALEALMKKYLAQPQ